jgi:hypothetical protein
MLGISHLERGIQIAGAGLGGDHHRARIGEAVSGRRLRHQVFALPGALGLWQYGGVVGLIGPFQPNEIAFRAVEHLGLNRLHVVGRGGIRRVERRRAMQRQHHGRGRFPLGGRGIERVLRPGRRETDEQTGDTSHALCAP